MSSELNDWKKLFSVHTQLRKAMKLSLQFIMLCVIWDMRMSGWEKKGNFKQIIENKIVKLDINMWLCL